jgi:TonB-linked SusC/RagA family outer membrane protein
MKSLLGFISLALLFSMNMANAQGRQVSGTVTDAENQEGLPGVNVLIEDTSIGTVTDLNGDYVIEVSSDDDVLVFSYVGYLTQEIVVGNRSVIDVALNQDIQALEEIVVIGYGEAKVKDLTSAISTVKTEELVKTPTGQAMQALQGKVAGVQVVSAGAPGASPTVRIRGLGSFPTSSDSSPLYVVDGMYFDNIDFLNPNDIETLSVLKDASASAIYGVRAANGVVLITTKNGSLNTQSTVTYEGYFGVQVPQNVLQMSNSEQFVNYVNQTGDPADISFIDNAMQRYGRSRVNPNVPDVNTDWYAEIMKPYAIQQNHSLSILGGNDKTAYAIGVNYFDQEGLLDTDDSYQRLNVRTKLDHQVNNWLKAGVNLNVSNGRRTIGNNAAWFRAYHAVPVMPVYDEENYEELLESGFENPSNLASAQLLGYRGSQNPIIQLEYDNNRQDIRKVLSGVYAQVDFIPDKLRFKSNYNVAMDFIKSRVVGLPYYITTNTNRDVSSISSSRTTVVNQFLDNTLTYTDNFGDHNFSAMVGTSYRDEWYDFLTASASDIPQNENSWYIGQSRVNESKTADDNAERIYGLSYFGRISYNYRNKYIAYVTVRQEGTSKYQEKWGTFPAFGLGWVISEESFFQGVNFVDFLKFRGGWGKLGNDKIPRQDGANTTNPVFLAIDDVQVNGTITTSTFGYLGWETVAGTNIGVTADFFDSRLNLVADYYVRDTENAAIPISLKLQPGAVLRNVGVIRNEGLEMSLNWNGEIAQDFRYNVGFNFATLKNEVLDLYGQEFINGGQGEFRQRSQPGEALNSFYGYEVAGVYQNQAEIDADPIATANGLVPGDFKFRDQQAEGEEGHGILDDDDKVFIGSYIPTLTYGGSLGLSYRNFDFSMNIMGQTGNKILNRKRGEIIWTNEPP